MKNELFYAKKLKQQLDSKHAISAETKAMLIVRPIKVE
jgi:hypothetical protein